MTPPKTAKFDSKMHWLNVIIPALVDPKTPPLIAPFLVKLEFWIDTFDD